MNTLVWGHVVSGSHTFHAFYKLLKEMKEKLNSAEKQHSAWAIGKHNKIVYVQEAGFFWTVAASKLEHFLDPQRWAATYTCKQQL